MVFRSRKPQLYRRRFFTGCVYTNPSSRHIAGGRLIERAWEKKRAREWDSARVQKDATANVERGRREGVQNRAIPRNIGFGGRARGGGGDRNRGWRGCCGLLPPNGGGFGTRRNWPAIAQKLERSRGSSFLFSCSFRHTLGASGRLAPAGCTLETFSFFLPAVNGQIHPR